MDENQEEEETSHSNFSPVANLSVSPNVPVTPVRPAPNTTTDLLRSSQNRLEELQTLVKTQQTDSVWTSAQSMISQLRADYQRVGDAVRLERTYFEGKLAELQEKVDLAQKDCSDYDGVVGRLKLDVRDKVAAINRTKEELVDLKTSLAEATGLAERLQEKLDERDHDLVQSNTKREFFEKRINSIKDELQLKDKQLQDALVRVDKSVQLFQGTILEKEKFAHEAAGLRRELERKQNEYTLLLEESGKRTQQEVAGVRAPLDSQVKSLRARVSQLESVVGEKQAQFERVVSDKQTVDLEVRKLEQRLAGCRQEMEKTSQQLLQRVHEAEAARDQANRELEVVRLKIKTIETGITSQQTQHEERTKLLEKRVGNLRKEVESANGERDKLNDRLTETLKSHRETLDERANEIGRLRILLSESEQRAKDVESASERKIKALQLASAHQSQAQHRSFADQETKLKQLLEDFQSMETSWKCRVRDMEVECGRLRQENDRLSLQLGDAHHDGRRLIRDGQRTKEKLVRMEKELEEVGSSWEDGSAASVGHLAETQDRLIADVRKKLIDLEQDFFSLPEY